PATYAAVAAALAETKARTPAFEPRSLLDAGAGPGTATWAALEAWPGIERARLVDSNPHLLALARQFGAVLPEPVATEFIRGDIAGSESGGAFDLVVSSYALTELADAAL